MIMLQQMTILFIVMLLGVLQRKMGIITNSSSKKLSSMVVNISNPCFILSSVIGENSIKGDELLKGACVSLTMFASLIIIAIFVPILLRIPKYSRGAYRAMTVFTNLGFMGFPLIAGMYGNEALLYGTLFILPFNILIYTYGIFVMTEGNSDGNKKVGSNLKKLINPGTVASILAILIYLTGVSIPSVIGSTVSMVGNITAPLSMMIIGASLGDMDIKEVTNDVRLLLFSIIKLLVIPLVGGLIMKIFIANEVLLGVSLIMISTPVASMTAMLSNQYGGDTKECTKGVAITTVFSVVTLPIVFAILL